MHSNNPSMPCETKKCSCATNNNFNTYLTKYINLDKVNATNIDGDIKQVFKTSDKIYEDTYVETIIEPHVSVVKIPFTAKLQINSIQFRSTFDEVRVFINDVHEDWRSMKTYEEFNFDQSLCMFECFLKNRRFRDTASLSFVLIGNEGMKVDEKYRDEEAEKRRLYYIGIKGKYKCELFRPVIATYSTISTRSNSLIREERVSIIC